MKDLTHIDADGRPSMVDVSDKPQSVRTATAKGMIYLNEETVQLISENGIKKGNVLTTAELAGVQAAKRTYELIPLCHTLMLSKVKVRCTLCEDGVEVDSEVKCTGQTGVEMEALTAVSVALLTIYDMCKAVDKKMIMSNIVLVNKDKTEVV
jgi:cyclic pyranopterin phosphate synthase